MTMLRVRRSAPALLSMWLSLVGLVWGNGFAELTRPAAAQTWSNKVTTTPSLVQTDFGKFGHLLPLDGEVSCGATAITMSLLWLGKNGFTQLAPLTPNEEDALRLLRIITGLSVINPPGPVVEQTWYQYTVSTYLSLKGIGPGQVTWDQRIGPDVEWFNTVNQNQTIVNFDVGWYVPDGGTYDRVGQHFLTLLSQDVPSGILTINNPYPAAFFDVPSLPRYNPQFVPTIPFDGPTSPPLPRGSYLQTNVPDANPEAGLLAVLESGWAWTIDASARPGAGWAPQPFALAPLQYVNNYTEPLEVLAPLTGTGGLHKLGTADLILTNTHSSSGENLIAEGLLVSTQRQGSPFGTGAVRVTEGGGLALRPGGPFGHLRLAIAGGDGSAFAYGPGARFVLDRGENDSLDVTVGGFTDGVTSNVVRAPGGTMTVLTQAGLGALGASERVRVAGAGGNLPRPENGILNPSVVGQWPDADLSGAFLTYGPDGLSLAQPQSSDWLALVAAWPTAVYALDNDQLLAPGQAPTVFALQGGPHAIRQLRFPDAPPATLHVGSGLAGGQAGVILNGTLIDVGALDFGASEGVIYTSKAGGRIDADIVGSGGLTLFGPGELTLRGNNAFTGLTNVNSGTVIVAGTEGTGLGQATGGVNVNARGRLVVESDATVAAPITVAQDAFLVLNGGTIGGLSVNYGGFIVDGGIVEGHGTIGGPAAVQGTLRAGATPGVLTFHDNASFSNAFFYWTLTALADTPGPSGHAWNSIVFENDAVFGTAGADVWWFLDFRGIPDPDSDHPFWLEPHQWLVVQFAPGFLSIDRVTTGNFSFRSGQFSLSRQGELVYLVYTPNS